MAGEGTVVDREADRIRVGRNCFVSQDDIGYWKWSQRSPSSAALHSLKVFQEYDVTDR